MPVNQQQSRAAESNGKKVEVPALRLIIAGERNGKQWEGTAVLQDTEQTPPVSRLDFVVKGNNQSGAFLLFTWWGNAKLGTKAKGSS